MTATQIPVDDPVAVAVRGYREIEPYAERLSADHWFERTFLPAEQV